jgi:organic radical activating enzyme
MTKIRITENFYSLQGEGQYVGVPSIFLRTFGCNFRCKKFGLPINQEIGKYNPEVENIINNIDNYQQLKDLPLVSTGCDTYNAIYPEFKKFSQDLDIIEIVDKMKKLLPGGQFDKNKHLILTGGEPLLGWQRAYPELLDECLKIGLTHLTFETNGTQVLNTDLRDYLNYQSYDKELEVTFSISAKLPCSGEPWEKAIRPEVVNKYLGICNNRSYFKFVVATQQDVDDALKAIKEYNNAGIDIPVYLMPVGGVNSIYNLNERQVADYCRDNGLRFSPRIQVELYKNAWGA